MTDRELEQKLAEAITRAAPGPQQDQRRAGGGQPGAQLSFWLHFGDCCINDVPV